MKKWILIVFVMSFLADGDILTKDYIDTGRINIKGKTGETKGWLKKDTLDLDMIQTSPTYSNFRRLLKSCDILLSIEVLNRLPIFSIQI